MAGGFEELGLASELVRAVKDDLGYLLPTDVQDEAIPLILGGGDVMVAAETGSGKTAAFSLPLLQIVHEDLRLREGADSVREKSAGGPTGERLRGGWRISEVEKDLNVAVSADGLACQSRELKWVGARGQNGIRGGVYCYEGTVDDEGICRFGWATRGANFNLGTDAFGYGFGSTGMKSHRGQFEKYGEPFSKGDTVGCRLDLVKGEVSFSKNGQELGVAFNVPAASRTEQFFPAVAFKNAQASFNFATCSVARDGAAPLASASPQHAVMASSENSSVRTPRAIILEPAKELAEQVSDCLSTLKKYFTSPRLEHALLVGGTNRQPILSLLKSSCDVIVGTPGRVLDFMEKGFIDCSAVRVLVVDEADRLLAPDSREQLMKIYMRLPHGGVGNLKLQVGFFSATLHSPEIAELSEIICDRPTWVDLKGRDVVPDAVQHVVVRVDPDGDAAKLVAAAANVHVRTEKTAGFGSGGREEQRSERLKRLKPQVLLGIIQALAMDQAMLFCRTNLDCDILENFLTEAGGGKRSSGGREGGKKNDFSCRVLSGMRPTNQRRANLQAFKDGHVRFLVCTDVAARGVDIKGLEYVVNMTLPEEPENYIHRVGRVGRQGCQGVAVSIVACDDLMEKVWYHKCSDRGRNCSNRATLTEGGCTTWYDEPSKLKAIEKHLGAPIAELGPGYSLPPANAPQPSGAAIPHEDRAKARGGGAGTDSRERMAAHVQMLKPTVRELARLEFEAQNNWLGMLKGRF